MHGYKVCRTLRDEGVWTPILILTAKDGEYDEAEALDTGADDFLSKPFSFVVLLARLRALIRRGAPPRPTVLTVGTLELDPGARRVPARRHRHPADRARVRAARVPHAQGRQRRVEGRDPRPRVGHRLRRATRTSSRCTSATCARRSTQPFGVETHQDGARRGLPARRRADVMTRDTPRRTAIVVAAVRPRPADDRRDARVRDRDQRGRVRARAARAHQPGRPDPGDQPDSSSTTCSRTVDSGELPPPPEPQPRLLLRSTPTTDVTSVRTAAATDRATTRSAAQIQTHGRQHHARRTAVDRPRSTAPSQLGERRAARRRCPLLIALVALAAWYFTGRALRPVEAIRAAGRVDHRLHHPPPRARTRHRRRGRAPRAHDERDARPARAVVATPAPVRVRRVARAAQPAGVDPHEPRGRAAQRRPRRLAGGRRSARSPRTSAWRTR